MGVLCLRLGTPLWESFYFRKHIRVDFGSNVERQEFQPWIVRVLPHLAEPWRASLKPYCKELNGLNGEGKTIESNVETGGMQGYRD